MSTQPRTWTPLWPLVEPRIVAAQPNGRMPKPNAEGWYGGLRSPLRKEDRPSFSVKPDSDIHPGGFEDHGTGESGPLSKLAQLMNIDPHVSSSATPPEPVALTLSTFCDQRHLDPGILVSQWKVRQVQHEGRPALRYSTVLGIPRIKFLDKGKGLKKYTWDGQGGRRHWYGLKGALALDGPLYLVNGEPSVWACQQQGVAAICLCGGEGAAPTAELVAELQAAGVAEMRVVYDRDDKGRAGAPTAVAALVEGGIAAAAYELPAHLGETGDVDDLQRWEGANLGQALAVLPRLVDPMAPVRKLLHADALDTLPKPSWLIPGILPTNQISTLFGPGGIGKSFMLLDIALSVAQFAPVIYIAAEDAEMYQVRIPAWRAQHGLGSGNLHFWPEPIDLLNPESIAAFMAEVAPMGPALVIVDTLASCMVGADENSTRDMNLAMDGLNKIRRQTHAAILVCHHTGWSDQHERGSSILRATCRNVMRLKKSDDGLLTLSSEKINGGKEFAPLYFRMIPQAESVVPVPSSKLTSRDAPLTEKHYALLEALELERFAGGASHSDIVDHLEFAKSTVNNALSKLMTEGLIESSGARFKRWTLTATGRAELENHRFASSEASSAVVRSKFGEQTELGLNWAVTLPGNSATLFEVSSVEIPHPDAVVRSVRSEFGDSSVTAEVVRSAAPPLKGAGPNSAELNTEQVPPGGRSNDERREAEIEIALTEGNVKRARKIALDIRGNLVRKRVDQKIEEYEAAQT